MSTIQELGAFLSRETTAVAKLPQPSANGRARSADVPPEQSAV
jgi:hypothetical protein